MLFREFITTGIDDPDLRLRKYARVNMFLAGLIVATGGMVAARLVDGSVLATIVLAPVVGVVGVAVMLAASFVLFQRGESDK
ncbi:hypothetical protein [Corynebacterium sp.]|uniref:hypothetical protein n=1 Tax=Corynebacterium sp. TaxID=1720 RepID=UPI0025BFB9A7|nr:hypothetical protein [Corynebacterium sp.]